MQYFIISFSLCFACSVIVFCFIIWVVGFEEPLTGSRLVLSHLLLGVCSHFLMHFNVALYAQQLAVADVVA